MKIIVDAMGGDNAPQAPVIGALDAVREYGTEVILVGRGEEILAVMKEQGVDELPPGVEIVHASEAVEMCDNPATAFKEKKNSSLTVGLNLLKEGKGAAFVSAGSTGALLSGATLIVKRIKGIRRAALCPVLPTGDRGMVLVDCGANAVCTPEYLLQFAFMGSYYAERTLGCPEPRVGLLNIGTEESKGTDLKRAREAIMGGVDVLVCDGYSGNVLLKTVEGTALYMAGLMKGMFKKNAVTKLAAVLVSGVIKEFKKKMDFVEVGGTALMGIAKPVVKAHGSSDAYAMKNAVRQAMRYASSGIVEGIAENIEYMRIPAQGKSAGATGEME